MKMNRPRILVVEDDDLQYELYEEALKDYELIRAKTASRALQSLPKDRPHVIILDHVLARGELGLDYLPEMKDLLPYVPIIIVSGALEVAQQMGALQGPRRAHYCLTKPVDLEELKRTIATALRDCGEAEVIRQFEALERSRRVDVEELLSRSTDRLARQTEIRRQLQGTTERPNISALARRFRVARRTIIRDLHELIRRGELPAELYPPWEGGEGGEEEEASSPGPAGGLG
ncbi:MAG: response regulator [Verrucomicrobia bacterium]|nr:response regulator [Verrucomicrobiota bacterium]